MSQLQKIEADLKAKGQRFTAPRKKVMEILLKNQEPMKAYDIVEAWGDAKPMTVYRALDFLVSRGVAHRIESLNAYVPCADSHCTHKDSEFFICENCGRVEELHSHAIDAFIETELKKNGFQMTAKNIEIRGLCNRCTDQASAKTSSTSLTLSSNAKAAS